MKYLKLFESFWQNGQTIGILNNAYAFRGQMENYEPPFGGSGYYKGTYFYIGKDAEEKAKKMGPVLLTANVLNANLYELDTPEILKSEAKKAGYEVREATGSPECDYLKSIGYDGIKLGSEIVLFDKNKFLV